MEIIENLPKPNVGSIVYMGDAEKLVRYECSNMTRIRECIVDDAKGITNIPEAKEVKAIDLFSTYIDKKNMNANHRMVRMRKLLQEYKGKIDVDAMKLIASDHGGQGEHK